MIFFVAIVALMAVCTCRVSLGKPFQDYIASDKILPIKGILVLLVFASHFVGYVELEGRADELYLYFRSFLGQLIVVPFLFYSGYGVFLSALKKGDRYIKSMPLKRIFKVYFQFNCAIVLFLIYRLATGQNYSISHILLTSIGWSGIGNSNWYIFAILFLYLLLWISLSIFPLSEKNGKISALVSFTILRIYFIYVVAVLKGKDGDYYYNTALAFSAGCWYAAYQDKIERFLFHGKNRYWFILFLSFIAFFISHRERKNLIFYELHAVLFAFLTILFTTRVQINNRFLAYCGKHLFSLYILQRLPMLILKNSVLSQYKYWYFLVCIAITFFLSAIFDWAVPRIWNQIQKKIETLTSPC